MLISAYACEPNKGSEPAAGWNWSLAAAQEHEVWVLTRANNREPIEAELARRPQPNLHFVYIDLPAWARRWKRGQRGVRLYYALWQGVALRKARNLHAEVGFDVAHHVTFANAWMPASVSKLGLPFVLGPVGGGPEIPLALLPELGLRGAVFEVARRLARAIASYNPSVRGSWRAAQVILTQNRETVQRLPTYCRGKARILPNPSAPARLANTPDPTPSGVEIKVLCAGRLKPWKGVSLVIRAIARTPSARLLVVGSGSDERRLRRLMVSLGQAARVSFVPWLPQDALWGLFSDTAVLVLPSLREDASFLVLEAQTHGVPVIAFASGGPRILAERPGASVRLLPLRNRKDAVTQLADAIGSAASLQRPSGRLLAAWDRKLPERLTSIYTTVVNSQSRRYDQRSQ